MTLTNRPRIRIGDRDAPPADSCCLSTKRRNMLNLLEHMTKPPRRFTKTDPCPICGGHDALGRGQGVRCFGYYDGSGKYARCTREERAGGMPQNRDGTYSHRLHGTCRCGQSHGQTEAPAGNARPAAAERPPQPGAAAVPLVFHAQRRSSASRYGEGTEVRSWIYRDAAGAEAFRVLRIDYNAPDGSKAKSYRPCHQAADGKWLLSRPAVPLPLYNLPAILAAPPDATVAILEGEKCADLATDLGLPHATTSAHGAKAPQLTDWSPLAGRSVAILGDADADGMGYATKVAALLAALDSSRPCPHRHACPACPTARTSSSGSPIAAWPARPTPRSSPSCAALIDPSR